MTTLANPTPYPGAPPSPVAATPGTGAPGAAPAPAQDPNGTGDLCRRALAIKTQADTLSKQLGYLHSDSSLHEQIPARIENKLAKALDALSDVVSQIDDVCEDMTTLDDPKDDDDDEDDSGKDD